MNTGTLSATSGATDAAADGVTTPTSAGAPTPHLGRAEMAGDDIRLTYVALTRAQSQVVAWWAP